MNFEIGSTLGDYQVIEILGAGGMGKVYKVRNLISDRVEAMKVLLPDLATEPELADRFLREIKVHASLEHPNIAALHTAVRLDNQLLMLMEYVEGVTLDQRLKSGPLPVAEVIDYMRQVLAALEYAHGRGVIHRDLKPANMMLTPAGMVKLMDFGIAKGATDRRLTMTGTTMGSLYYMSPEQIQGTGGIDARSDIYSLGVSLYELVTGKRPFDGDTQFAIMNAHLTQPPVPPIQLEPHLPPLLNDVILMAVAKDPNERFQTATAFRNALGNVALPVTVAAPPPVAAAMPAGAPRGKRGLWMAIGAVAAVGALVAVVELGPHKGAGAQSPPAPQQQQTAAPAVTAPAAAVPDPAPPAQKPSEPVAAPPQSAPAPESAPPARQQAAKPASVPAVVQQQQQQPVVQQPAVQQPAVQQPAVQQPAVQQPAVQQPAPTPQQAAAPAPAAPQPDAAAARRALSEAREEMIQLNARAAGIRGTLEKLERAQAANGLGMSSTLHEPATLMNTYLDETANAINAGDAEAAKSFAAKAEKQIERLEKLLNR